MERLSRLWVGNKQQGSEYISLVKVYEKLTKSFMLSKAVDFIVHFGLSGVAYGCPWCMETPTNPQNLGKTVLGANTYRGPGGSGARIRRISKYSGVTYLEGELVLPGGTLRAKIQARTTGLSNILHRRSG